MRCYRCNNTLDANSDYCLKCGADVSMYKIIVRSSNTYYNQGLAKAKVRDLSGAVVSLKTSISINKNNTKARNLLGLVYYEMGEVVMALSEWVVSKNIRPERNVADAYIRMVQENPGKLDNMNQAVKKFNQSLSRAKEKNYDMALISLKKVVSMNPNLIKAQLLLALLYMQAGQNDKAAKCLNKVLKIDCNNTVARKYLAEINGQYKKLDDESLFARKRKKSSDESSEGSVNIFPRNNYREPSSGIFTVLSILLGVAIGAAMIWYLVLPSKIASVNYENSQAIVSYSEQISAGSIENANLNGTIASLTSQVEELKGELSIYIGDEGQANMYSLLVEVANSYISGNYAEATALLDNIDIALLPTQTAKDVYTTMYDNLSKGADQFAANAANAYKNKDYMVAADNYKAVLALDEENSEAMYYLYVCYEEMGDLETAYEGYSQFVTDFPTSALIGDVTARMNRIVPSPETADTNAENTENASEGALPVQ